MTLTREDFVTLYTPDHDPYGTARDVFESNLDHIIAAAISEAVKAEREANCAAMCRDCAAGLKAVEGDQKTWGGRFVHWLPDEQRYVGCGAHNIRARGGK